MTPQEIKDRLKHKKVSQYRLSKKWGVSASMLSRLIDGKAVSRRLDKRLARVLGVTLEELRRNDGEAVN